MADIHPESADGWTAASQNRPALATVPGAGSEMSWKAADSGYKSWTFNPEMMPASGSVASVTLANGKVTLAGIKFPGGLATGIAWYQKTTGSSPTTAFLGLLNSAGALVAVTADLATPMGTGSGVLKTANFASSAVLPAGKYYVAALNGGGTAAVLGGLIVGPISVNLAQTAPGRSSNQLGTGLTAIAATNDLTTATLVTDVPWFGIF